MDWWKQLILLVVLAAALWAAFRLGRRKGDNSRSARLMKKYRVMSPELLDAIPEGERADAVVSRVLAQAQDTPAEDPLVVLSQLQRGYTVVYSVWVVCREMAAGDFASLMASCSRQVAELAGDSFAQLGASACAEAWQALLAAEKGTDTAAAEGSFRRAMQEECPLSLCEDYIPEHREEFIDAAENTAQSAD